VSYSSEDRYTKEHEWVRIEGNRARVGVTDHAQAELGDVVFVELPAVGSGFKQGDNFGTVESVKAVSDIYAPLSGKIVEVNVKLESTPEGINQSPHDEAWLIVLEMSDPSEVDALLTAADYEAQIAAG